MFHARVPGLCPAEFTSTTRFDPGRALTEDEGGHAPSSRAVASITGRGAFSAFLLPPLMTIGGRDHAAHHALTGNLDARVISDIITLTVSEYCARS